MCIVGWVEQGRVGRQSLCEATAEHTCVGATKQRQGQCVCLKSLLLRYCPTERFFASPQRQWEPQLDLSFGRESQGSGWAPVACGFPALVNLPWWFCDSRWMLWLWETVVLEQDMFVGPEAHPMECWVRENRGSEAAPCKRVCVGSRAWGGVCFWCLWLFLLEFSSDGFYPPATPTCMGLEGGPPCELVPDRVVAKVSIASLPFWHLVWDQKPQCSVVCTAVICIIAVFLAAAHGCLHCTGSPAFLQGECALGLCNRPGTVFGIKLSALLSITDPYITHIIRSIVQNRSRKNLKRASSSLFRGKAVPGLCLEKGVWEEAISFMWPAGTLGKSVKLWGAWALQRKKN